jgi:hypothetical protein
LNFHKVFAIAGRLCDKIKWNYDEQIWDAKDYFNFAGIKNSFRLLVYLWWGLSHYCINSFSDALVSSVFSIFYVFLHFLSLIKFVFLTINRKYFRGTQTGWNYRHNIKYFF